MIKLKSISLLIIVLCSVLFSLFIVSKDAVLQGGDDSYIYFMLGRNLFEGEGYTVFEEPHFLYPPLPSGITVLFFKLFGVSEFVATLPWILFSALMLVLCFFFMNYFTNGKIAIIGTALLALHFDFVYLSTIIRADMLFMFLFYAFIFITVKAFEENKTSYFYWAAVVVGLSNLTKYILGPLFLLLLLYLLYTKRKQGISLVITMFLIFVLINAPWLYRNYQYHGTPFFSDFKSVFKMYNNPADTTLYGVQQANDGYYAGTDKTKSLSAFFSDFKLFTKKIIINTGSGILYFLPKSIGFLILFLAFLNLFISLTNHFSDFKKQAFVIVGVIYIILFAIIMVPHLKFYTFLAPVFIMWGIQGCFRTVGIVFRNSLLKYFVAFVLILMIMHSYIYALIPTLIGNRVTSRFENPSLEGKDVGIWLKDNVAKDARIMSTRIDFSFYGDKKYYIIPLGNLTKVKEYAKRNNINYVVYDKRISFYWRPEIRTLLDDMPKEGLELVHVHKIRDRIFDEVYVWKLV